MATTPDFRTLLQQGQSKSLTVSIAKKAGAHAESVAELLSLVWLNHEPISRRAAWVIEVCDELYPEALSPHVDELIEQLPKLTQDPERRHITKILARRKLPESSWGTLYNCCFQWLLDPNIAVAVKVFSMTILGQIAANEPELQPELEAAITELVPRNSAGFASRAKQVLKQFNK